MSGSGSPDRSPTGALISHHVHPQRCYKRPTNAFRCESVVDMRWVPCPLLGEIHFLVISILQAGMAAGQQEMEACLTRPAAAAAVTAHGGGQECPSHWVGVMMAGRVCCSAREAVDHLVAGLPGWRPRVLLVMQQAAGLRVGCGWARRVWASWWRRPRMQVCTAGWCTVLRAVSALIAAVRSCLLGGGHATCLTFFWSPAGAGGWPRTVQSGEADCGELRLTPLTPLTSRCPVAGPKKHGSWNPHTSLVCYSDCQRSATMHIQPVFTGLSLFHRECAGAMPP
jgi:hypothetical protein